MTEHDRNGEQGGPQYGGNVGRRGRGQGSNPGAAGDAARKQRTSPPRSKKESTLAPSRVAKPAAQTGSRALIFKRPKPSA